MESTGLPGTIQLSPATYGLLPDSARAECMLRSAVEIKGKGLMSTYLVESVGPGRFLSSRSGRFNSDISVAVEAMAAVQ